MRIECPSCRFSAEVDPVKIPPGGGNTRCPRCTTTFFVTAPEPAPPAAHLAAEVCPKCGSAQAVGESCSRCGIFYEKYRAGEERRQMMAAAGEAAPEGASLPAESTTFRFGYARGEIVAWAGDGCLAPDEFSRAARIAGMLPGRAEWRGFLDGLALWLGAVFLATAVIFFFAYNWQELGHFTRFGIVEVLLVAAVATSWRLGLGRMSGQAALLVAMLLVGALLALVGQTYQTGADPWELFANWALFTLPWVAVACFPPLWLVWLALVNLAVSLYYHAFAGLFGLLFGTKILWWTLAGVNTAALAAWELAASRGVGWLAPRWAPRIVATASAGYITLLAAWGIIDAKAAGIGEFSGFCVWLACAFALYRRKVRDLYVLALGILSTVVVVTVYLGHNLARNGDPAAFLFVGMAVLGLSAAGGWWLRTVAGEVGA